MVACWGTTSGAWNFEANLGVLGGGDPVTVASSTRAIQRGNERVLRVVHGGIELIEVHWWQCKVWNEGWVIKDDELIRARES